MGLSPKKKKKNDLIGKNSCNDQSRTLYGLHLRIRYEMHIERNFNQFSFKHQLSIKFNLFSEPEGF